MKVASTHLFILDPFETLNLALDSSLRIAQALQSRGGEIYASTIGDLYWSSDLRGAMARTSKLHLSQDLAQTQQEDVEDQPLGDFSSIHMRKDPPFDNNYLFSTLLLDSTPLKTRIYNRPSALRTINEKLAILRFPETIRPAIASSSPKILCAFARSHGMREVVLKPLDLFGGRGIARISISKEAEFLKELEVHTGNGQNLRLLQEFDPAITQGEARAFVVGGELDFWCLKKPKAGNYLANTAAGATLHSYQPSDQERERVMSIAKKLMPMGITIVGFDVIGGYISEINVTSPRLLSVGPTDAFEKIADWLIKDLG